MWPEVLGGCFNNNSGVSSRTRAKVNAVGIEKKGKLLGYFDYDLLSQNPDNRKMYFRWYMIGMQTNKGIH